MIITFVGLAATYAYLLLLAYRVGHGGRHARVWARPRPLKLLAHGSHTAAPARSEASESTSAVAA
jgi:hypothetical protein